jgi:hypothetical protein
MNMPGASYGIEPRVCPLWVLFKPTEDVPGHWTAHCLDLDVVSIGTTLSHAMGMIVEAAEITLQEDLQQGRDPHDRKAPGKYWDELSRIVTHGQRVSFSEILSPGASKNWKALALQINLRLDRARHVEGQEITTPMMEPAELALS